MPPLSPQSHLLCLDPPIHQLCNSTVCCQFPYPSPLPPWPLPIWVCRIVGPTCLDQQIQGCMPPSSPQNPLHQSHLLCLDPPKHPLCNSTLYRQYPFIWINIRRNNNNDNNNIISIIIIYTSIAPFSKDIEHCCLFLLPCKKIVTIISLHHSAVIDCRNIHRMIQHDDCSWQCQYTNDT